MPVYFYRCDNCLENFKIKHSVENTQEECPSCEKLALVKMPPPTFFNKRQEELEEHRESLQETSPEDIRYRVEHKIEENRSSIEEMKEKFKTMTFDPRSK